VFHTDWSVDEAWKEDWFKKGSNQPVSDNWSSNTPTWFRPWTQRLDTSHPFLYWLWRVCCYSWLAHTRRPVLCLWQQTKNVSSTSVSADQVSWWSPSAPLWRGRLSILSSRTQHALEEDCNNRGQSYRIIS